MAEEELISQSEFARRMKFGKGLIARYKKAGIIKMQDGKVQWLASRKAVRVHRALANPAQVAEQAVRHAGARAKNGNKHEYADGEKGSPMGSASFIRKIGQAKGRTAIIQADRERMRYEKEAGKLVELEAVQRAAGEAGRIVRDMLLLMTPELSQKVIRETLSMLPEEWASKVAGALDHRRIATLLTEEYRNLLTAVAQMVADPLSKRTTQ
jgi:hypothetical protein